MLNRLVFVVKLKTYTFQQESKYKFELVVSGPSNSTSRECGIESFFLSQCN